MYWPQIQLRIEPDKDGLLVSQEINGEMHKYVATGWSLDGHLGDIVKGFVETSTRNGLTAALQKGHPGAEHLWPNPGLPYLSFSTGYEERWVCAIDQATRGPKGTAVISNRHELVLRKHGIEFTVESASARNLRIDLSHLDSALQAIRSELQQVTDGEPDRESDSWTEEELRAAVQAYLEMQRKHRRGEAFVKTQHYENLARQFGRTSKSFEYRMQNISYVLSLMGREWLSGLKPAKNVEARTAAIIERLIAEEEGQYFASDAAFEAQVKEELKKREIPQPSGSKSPQRSASTTTLFARDAKVKAWVLKQAGNQCECCGHEAPFFAADGTPYLEVHHLRRLADNGSDTVTNAVAICPNCHRELHFGGRAASLMEELYAKIERLERE